MKKIIIIIAFIIIIFLMLGDSSDKNFRIRIIADDNSEESQFEKQKCFEIIKKYISATSSKEDVVNNFKNIKDDLEIYGNLINKKINVEIKKTNFPPKELNSVLISGGSYETLLVEIGQSKGNNMWTLLYPEYFGITFEDIKTDNVTLKWKILELLNID